MAKQKQRIRLGAILLAGLPLMAQAPAAQPIKIGNVVFQGSFRTRLEGWNWFQGEANESYAFSGNILRFGFSQQRKSFDWQVEFAAPFLLRLPNDAIAPAPQLQFGLGGNYYSANKNSRDAGLIFPKQAFVRLKELFGDQAQSLRLGRFEFNDGTEATPADPTLAALKRERVPQRLIGTFGFTHIMRSFDGAHYVYNLPKFNLTFVGALPTRGVFQVDGWGNLHTAFGYLAATGQVPRAKSAGEWRLFGIYYHDWRNIVFTDNQSAAARRGNIANIRVGTFGGHYLHTAPTSAGPVDFLAWGALQTGRWGRQDHSGAIYAVEAGWQPKILPRLKPWINGGYSYSTGDKDPTDDKHQTFFQILPTPRPYARFPFFNMMNNQDMSGMLTLRPHRAVKIRSEFHALRLTSARDLWYLGGGAFQPWSFGYIGRPSNGARSLANLIDAGLDYSVNAKLSLSAYYGYAIGKSVITSIYPKGKDGSLGYLELSYKF